MKRLLPLLLALSACGQAEQREALPGVSLLENFSMAETVAGAWHWSLDAQKGRLDEKKGVITFTKPRIKFYEADAVTSEITSRAGSLKMAEKAAVLNDDVVVYTVKDSMKLVTTRLYYSAAKGKIWTEEPLTIYKGRTVIKGKGFTANPDLSQIEIQQQETRMAGQ